jgi:hypothetical protein
MMEEQKISFFTLNARSLSGWLFMIGNVSLLALNIWHMDALQLVSSILLILCSFTLILSNKDIRWFYIGGALVMTAYGLIALSAQGDGKALQIAGTILPMIHALLLFRTAWQGNNPSRFIAKNKLGKPLELVDRYPLASAGLIEFPGLAFICLGSLMSQDWDLAFSSGLWVMGALFMAWSDPALEAKRQKKKSA